MKSFRHFPPNSPIRRRLGSSHHKRYICGAITTESGCVIVYVPAQCQNQFTHNSSQKHPAGDCPPQEPSHVSSLGGGRVPSRHCIHTIFIQFSFYFRLMPAYTHVCSHLTSSTASGQQSSNAVHLWCDYDRVRLCYRSCSNSMLESVDSQLIAEAPSR